MGKGYWEFITSDEKKLPLLENPTKQVSIFEKYFCNTSGTMFDILQKGKKAIKLFTKEKHVAK
jgi:hypothetical protein